MPSVSAALATSTPTAPRPTTPNVRPGSSKPRNCFLPASIFFSRSSPASCKPWTYFHAGQIFLAASNKPAIASSFTAFALAPGALNTGTPRTLSFSIGMLFTPAPARPIATTDSGISMSCMSCERKIIASGCAISEATSYRSRGRRRKPATAILFNVRILYIRFYWGSGLKKHAARTYPFPFSNSCMKPIKASIPSSGIAL